MDEGYKEICTRCNKYKFGYLYLAFGGLWKFICNDCNSVPKKGQK